MEWSIGEENIRYTAELSDNEGEMTVNSVKKEDEEIPISDISISYNSNLDQFLVNIDKISKLAHVVKVKDSYWIHLDGRIHIVNSHEIGYSNQKQSEGSLVAPMPGTIIEILVKKGQRVRKGQSLMVMEAMKMEHKIQSPKDGEVISISNEVGQKVDMGAVLVEIVD
ncbi:MAG: biotin/lipoyl-containing protein [Candidatus Thalassarchaeaceae archaeon]|jgi:acetyl/propionyl-CoA carboxylase alpha subunit